MRSLIRPIINKVSKSPVLHPHFASILIYIPSNLFQNLLSSRKATRNRQLHGCRRRRSTETKEGSQSLKQRMMDLLNFYETSRIPEQDRDALRGQGIESVHCIKSQMKIMRNITMHNKPRVTEDTLKKIRALLHYFQDHEVFDGDAFETHLLLHAAGPPQPMKAAPGEKKKKEEDSIDFIPMPEQGFKPSSAPRDDPDKSDDWKALGEDAAGGPDEIVFENKVFKKSFCYHEFCSDRTQVIVGIQSFIVEEGSPAKAVCVLIESTSKTILWKEKSEEAELYDGEKYIQNWSQRLTRPLSKLHDTCSDIKKMPTLCYRPQRDQHDRSFGYFYDPSSIKSIGRRTNRPKMIDLFCGSGGVHQGFKDTFDLVSAIDSDPDAVKTFRHNNPEAKDAVECKCVNKYLAEYTRNGTVELLGACPPCQGHSRANRNRNKNESEKDKENNELSLCFTEGLKKTQALTGFFENVEGIWSEISMPYLKRSLLKLAEMKYQFYTMVLNSRDYGDPQTRMRFFIFVACHYVPLPPPPLATHGGVGGQPWKTTGDVLEMYSESPKDCFPNMNDRKTSNLQPGDNDYEEIVADKQSLTIRASGPAIFHYLKDEEGNRQCISVREAAAIQGYPNTYEFFGNLTSKFKQVGNSVPSGLATAIARSFSDVLKFVYRGEDIEMQGRKEVNLVQQKIDTLEAANKELQRRRRRRLVEAEEDLPVASRTRSKTL